MCTNSHKKNGNQNLWEEMNAYFMGINLSSCKHFIVSNNSGKAWCLTVSTDNNFQSLRLVALFVTFGDERVEFQVVDCCFLRCPNPNRLRIRQEHVLEGQAAYSATYSTQYDEVSRQIFKVMKSFLISNSDRFQCRSQFEWTIWK